jgi:hypothetical protein
MYALDTNILVYAQNIKSPYHASARVFVEQVMNTRNPDGQLSVCLPVQILMEFLNVITWHRLEAPLPLSDAIQVVQDYLDTDVAILYPKPTQLATLMNLLQSVTTRKNIFDVALVATLKDSGMTGLYTVNTKDFEECTFLDVNNPL